MEHYLHISIVSMMLMQKLTPQPTGDPDQAKQQKFMLYFMSIFFTLIFYNMPSGLNLYILTSNFIGVIENKRIRSQMEHEDPKQQGKSKKRILAFFGRWAEKLERTTKQIEAMKDIKSKKPRK